MTSSEIRDLLILKECIAVANKFEYKQSKEDLFKIPNSIYEKQEQNNFPFLSLSSLYSQILNITNLTQLQQERTFFLNH